ncbi:ion transporter [Coralloluteibacterium stylophorae]|uniref:Ion transporter n=1 Tax=Coralloluteibacterium stylophorae TaxID=1776034 RepID=A0A8J7VSY8_9GAMM|nr:ion transporter [Coralloluteibacterium stylophorae]MBS7458535.1 ion transporter [Coralloluteibacterium stylophorae]
MSAPESRTTAAPRPAPRWAREAKPTPEQEDFGPADGAVRRRLYRIIFQHDTRSGLAFDLCLIVAIVASVLIAMIDSVAPLHARHGHVFYALEWGFTIAFTAEYAIRLWIVRSPLRYARSFYGVIDLLAIIPTYASLLLAGSQYLLVVRILRILRVFRLLRLVRFLHEARQLTTALRGSARKIMVFVFAMLAIVTVFGALMYLVEGPEHGFHNIPLSMYWAIVTVATVGYGDIAPGTTLGRLLSSMLILIGYGMIAVPTGIYTAELASSLRARSHEDARRCRQCALAGHEADAHFCRNCGTELDPADGHRDLH